MTEEEARRSGLPLSTGGMMGETHRSHGGSTRPDKTGAGGPEEEAESRAEPKDDSYTIDEQEAAAAAVAQPAEAAPELPPPQTPPSPPASDEVAGINARFDRIEAKLKRKLALATFNERLARLEHMLED